MRTQPFAAVAALAALATAGCIPPASCTHTNMAAKPVTKVDRPGAATPAVVEALLTAGSALDGERIAFELLEDGATLYETSATTGADGTARADLERLGPQAVTPFRRATQLRATFAGDATYCASADVAPMTFLDTHPVPTESSAR
ncbi:MAG TPA: hypothetical protein VNA20_00240 [Frankiaceae bacterium]|nr:hypothetical protein [Frankiaceae bacterium]